jgi:hypothetical protein
VIATIGSKQTKFGVARGFAWAVPGGRDPGLHCGASLVSVLVHTFVIGFGTIAYTRNRVHPPGA